MGLSSLLRKTKKLAVRATRTLRKKVSGIRRPHSTGLGLREISTKEFNAVLNKFSLKHHNFDVIDNIDSEIEDYRANLSPGPRAVINLIYNEGRYDKDGICCVFHGGNDSRTAALFLDPQSGTLFYLDPWRISTGPFIDEVIDYIIEQWSETLQGDHSRFETNCPKKFVQYSKADFSAMRKPAATQAYVMMFITAMLTGEDETGKSRTWEEWIEFFKRDNISDERLAQAHAHFFSATAPASPLAEPKIK